MRRFVNCLDQTEFVRLLNRQFLALPRQEAFATAIVATFFAPTRRLTVCNAGHPRPLLYRAAERRWDFLGNEEPAAGPRPCNIPLGIIDLADYKHFDIELGPGDYVVSYTDALIESRDADGEMLGEDGLLRIMRLLGDVEAHEIIEMLLREIGERYPENLSEDDVTMLVMSANTREAGYSLGEKLKALMRFSLSMVRSIDPRAERPPFPDMNLANLGGAIIPALARRWRAKGDRSTSG
jgi:serine phosphatase RsbU (regulator of sigma subunit)